MSRVASHTIHIVLGLTFIHFTFSIMLEMHGLKQEQAVGSLEYCPGP